MIRPIENFYRPLKFKNTIKITFFINFHHIFSLQKQLSAIIKIQKSMSSHVCVSKKGLARHVITPSTLLDAHGPKEVSESKQYDLTTHKNFFASLKANTLTH